MAFDSDVEEVGGTNEVQYTEAKEPTKAEVVDQLRKPGIVGTIEAKRRLLCDVIAIRDDLRLMFTAMSRSIADSFAIVCADAQAEMKKKKGGAAKLADIIYELGIIFRTHSIQVEHGEQRKTRSGETVLGKKPYQSVLDALTDAIQAASYEKLAHAKSCIVKLSQEEKRRTYLSRGRKPLDEAYQQCLFCGHEYVDEPDSNQPNLRHNMKLKKEYEEKLRNFNEAKRAGREYIGEKGEPIHRAPTMPKEKPVILQCHCHEIVCFGKSQGPCIECRAKDNISRDLIGMCDSCDVCKCPCAYAYKVRNG
jgi:hypothetical protein